MNQFITPPQNYLIFLSLGLFLLTLVLLPRIRSISLKFGFTDQPGDRSSHKEIVPTFGGISFYIGMILTLFFVQNLDDNDVIATLMASASIMFFTGLKDDFHDISPRMKMLGQLISISLLMIHSEFRISSFYGLFGIYDLPITISVTISVILLLGLINAYNLIDGIDGMASITGIVVATSFGLLFYSLGLYFYLSICVALVSMLFGFLRYNFSSRKKIFMGDTGSLLVGLIIGILAMKLLSLGFDTVSSIAISRSEIPLLILGILIVPAFDISRVIFIRLSNRVPVFSPDRNHIHHVLVDAGLSHKQASLTVGVINTLIVAIIYFSIKTFGLLVSIALLFVLVGLLIYLFFVLNTRYAAIKTKVKVRKFLFKVFNWVTLSKKYQLTSERRLTFNQKLKNIRIFFF